MENYVTALALGIIGAALGFLLPNIAEKIALYKRRKKNLSLEPDKRFLGIVAKVILCLLSACGWSVAGLWINSPVSAVLISLLFSSSLLVGIIDMRIRIVPNELALAMVIAGAAFQALQFGLEPLILAVVCMVVMMILFTVVAGLMGFGKVGAGDVKLAGVMGIALGYPNIIIALVIMSASLLVYIAIGLLSKKLTLQSFFPFAPFMMSGMALALIYIALAPHIS